MKPFYVQAIFALAIFAFTSGQCLLADEAKPNIIIFLADDLGYADIGVNGCRDIPTPHIDSIAHNGVRFTDGYATHCVCSPSRAGLMSGRYQHRFGFEANSGPERFASDLFGLPRDVPTLAEQLKPLGYATGMVGKWHIGFKEGLRPWERGFDYHYGFLSGAHSYLPGKREADDILRNGQTVQPTKYLTDEFADEAVNFLDRSKAQPFFLYFAFNAVHAPMESASHHTEKFPELSGNRKTYAGMLSALDDAVGRVLTKVRELGQEENTLVFFYSDNGGPTPTTTSRNDPLRGYKGQFYEGGIRVPFLMQWKAKVKAGSVYTQPVMGFDCHATALAAARVNGRSGPSNSADGESNLDGIDLLPYLTGEKQTPPHDRLFWRAGTDRAVRLGDWKLVQEGKGAAAQLFNLREDLSESTDLAAKLPDKFHELSAAYASWEKEMQPAKWVRQDGRSRANGSGNGARRRQSRLEAADTNGDGQLSAAEFPDKEAFQEVDANHDGSVTPEEIRTYYSKRKR
jgi:arylsulfatase A-like enzyme